MLAMYILLGELHSVGWRMAFSSPYSHVNLPSNIMVWFLIENIVAFFNRSYENEIKFLVAKGNHCLYYGYWTFLYYASTWKPMLVWSPTCGDVYRRYICFNAPYNHVFFLDATHVVFNFIGGIFDINWLALQNQCQARGFCGPNSYCTAGNGSSIGDCSCLPGFFISVVKGVFKPEMMLKTCWVLGLD